VHKVLIIIDKLGWSYDTIAQGLVKYNQRTDLEFDIVAVNEHFDHIERHHADYDLIFPMGWTLLFSKKKKDRYRELIPFLDKRKLITGIHSHRSWDDYQSTTEWSPTPPAELLDKLAAVKGINIISKRLFRIFKDAGLSNVALTENGVDTDLFTPTQAINTNRALPLIFGFSGSKEISKHDGLKGFSEYIAPLAKIPNVEVRELGGRGPRQVARQHMPRLYNEIDLYICASSSEGFSQSVLEASSCGRGVISTKVGGCEDLIEEGVNGFIVPRNVEPIERLVKTLESDRTLVQLLGKNNRARILEWYSWQFKVTEWLEFIERHLPPNKTDQRASVQ
jgi:hypothetical protein